MNKEDKLSALRAKATKLGLQFAPEASIDELTALIKAVPPATAKPAASPQPPVTPAVPKTPKANKTSFAVHNSGGDPVRTYDVETHGGEAEALANEYATKIGGSVK